MKNILIIENGIATLLANADDGTNTIFINDEDIPASDWVGTGTYEYIESGVTFTIQKIEADTGNIMLQLIEGTSYRLVKQLEGQPYESGDPLSADLDNEDYVPFYDVSANTRKNSLFSNIIAKIKAALAAVATSGSYNDLSDKPTVPSVVNNLTSDSTTDALSAAQGKALATGSARDSSKLPLAGGVMTAPIVRNRQNGDNYISGPKGTYSLIHLNKPEGNYWCSLASTRTAGGGGWAIGNYNNENLQFIYGTKANIESDTNSVTKVDMRNVAGTIALTSDIPGVARGLGYNSSTNKYYIQAWASISGTAVNANGDVTWRYIANFACEYNTTFQVSRTTVVTPIEITISGTKYRYAPLFEITAAEAEAFLGDYNLPASGSSQAFARIPRAYDRMATVYLRIARSGSKYYICDDSLRSSTTGSNTGINQVLSGHTWHYDCQGMLILFMNW